MIRDISPTAWDAPGVVSASLLVRHSGLAEDPVPMDVFTSYYAQPDIKRQAFSGSPQAVVTPTNARILALVPPKGNALAWTFNKSSGGETGIAQHPQGAVVATIPGYATQPAVNCYAPSSIANFGVMWDGMMDAWDERDLSPAPWVSEGIASVNVRISSSVTGLPAPKTLRLISGQAVAVSQVITVDGWTTLTVPDTAHTTMLLVVAPRDNTTIWQIAGAQSDGALALCPKGFVLLTFPAGSAPSTLKLYAAAAIPGFRVLMF